MVVITSLLLCLCIRLSVLLPPPEPLLKYKIQEADWTGYAAAVDRRLPIELETPHDCQSSYESFEKLLLECADSFIPKKNSSSRRLTSPPWWDSECTTMIKLRKESELTYNHSMTPENFIAFQKISAKARRLFSKKKKKGWKIFCENISPKCPLSFVWQNLRRFRTSMSFESLSS